LQVLPRFLRVFEKIEKVAFLLLLPFWWGEQDSNLRSLHSRFTVCPRWPLEYLPNFFLLHNLNGLEPAEGLEPTTC
jgi:hypothetical protein